MYQFRLQEFFEKMNRLIGIYGKLTEEEKDVLHRASEILNEMEELLLRYFVTDDSLEKPNILELK